MQDGYELALAAALGGRLDAALVKDVPGAQALLDRAGPDGGERAARGPRRGRRSRGRRRPPAAPAPAAGALRLLDLLRGPPAVLELAGRLLADAWVVERLEDLPSDFAGIAAHAQRARVVRGWGEVRQLSEGGTERVLARRNERDRLVAEAERAAQAEQARAWRCERRSRRCVRPKRRARRPSDAARSRAPSGRGGRGASAAPSG